MELRKRKCSHRDEAEENMFISPWSTLIALIDNDQDLNKLGQDRPPSFIDTVTFDHLQPYMHLPLKQAAKELGMSDSNLKKICRHQGITGWPSRRIASKLKTLESIKHALAQRDITSTQKLIFHERISSLEQDIASILKNPSEGVPIRSANHSRSSSEDSQCSSPTPSHNKSSSSTPTPRHYETHIHDSNSALLMNISSIDDESYTTNIDTNSTNSKLLHLGSTIVLEEEKFQYKNNINSYENFYYKQKKFSFCPQYESNSVILAPLVNREKNMKHNHVALIQPNIFGSIVPDIVPNPFHLCVDVEFDDFMDDEQVEVRNTHIEVGDDNIAGQIENAQVEVDVDQDADQDVEVGVESEVLQIREMLDD